MESEKEEQKYLSEPGDCEADCIVRRWTDVAQPPDSLKNA